MKIGIGSKNKTKVTAITEVLADYPMFSGAEIFGMEVKKDEFGHPKNMQDIVSGAIDRAKQAFVGNEYGFGIEAGVTPVPGTKTGYMEMTVCAIFDGKQSHLGLSQGFEWPPKVLDKILNEGMDGSQAVKAVGMTEHEKMGEHEGIVGILTKGRVPRTEQNKTAVVMALIHLENPEHY